MNYYQKDKKIQEALFEFQAELQKAEYKHPDFPDDLIHQLSVMVEEAGEAVQAANQYIYEGGEFENVKKELIQTGAMCLRCLINLKGG